MGESSKNRRKRLIVDPVAQARQLKGITFIPLLGMLFAGAAVAVLAGRVFADARTESVELPSLVPMMLSIVLLCFCTVALLVLQAIRFSHRVAGPAYRISKTLTEFREGRREIEVRLREHDELKELAADLNGFLSWVRERLPQDPSMPHSTGAPASRVEETTAAS